MERGADRAIWVAIGILLLIMAVFVGLRLMTDVPNVLSGELPDESEFQYRYAAYPWLAYAHILPGALYLARAPKSNSVYTALNAAMEDAASAEPVPTHLRDASYPGARKLGHGEGYRYPHDFPGHQVEQEYRPVRFSGRRYYEPSGEGEEET